nr:MAG TPA: hypothetical protein [Caudoviricetes sp.]
MICRCRAAGAPIFLLGEINVKDTRKQQKRRIGAPATRQRRARG